MLYLNITGYHKVEGFKTKNVKYGNAGVLLEGGTGNAPVKNMHQHFKSYVTSADELPLLTVTYSPCDSSHTLINFFY